MAMEEEQKQRIIEEEEAQGVGQDNDGPAHNPSPPPDELFDISTTVDPSYIISMVRKLLPTDVRNGEGSHGSGVAHNQCRGAADGMEEHTTSSSEKKVRNTSQGEHESMEIESGYACEEHMDDSCQRHEQNSRLAVEETWEEYGCILWDLAASRTHAELMVENLIVEVLRVNIMASKSPRVTEICLGIIGNLACHSVPLNRIESTSGMIDIIVDQLFLDDTQCLNEVCRILTSGFHGTLSTPWVESLQSEHILRRILWITGNTLNPQLLEKVVGLLLAIIEGQSKAGLKLLSSLMDLGLANLLIDLLSFEMDKLMRERMPDRNTVLDVILRALEALSVVDGHSQEICSNKELFQLICGLIKFRDKAEVATSCITAGVLVANMLSDQAEFSSDLVQDFPFLQGMFDILQYASDDIEAKGAIWSVIARLLVRVHEAEINLSFLHQYVLIFVSTCEVIEEDLLDYQLEEFKEESGKSNARLMAIRKVVSILNQWDASNDHPKEKDMKSAIYASDVHVERLLDCCCRYIESNAGPRGIGTEDVEQPR